MSAQDAAGTLAPCLPVLSIFKALQAAGDTPIDSRQTPSGHLLAGGLNQALSILAPPIWILIYANRGYLQEL